MSGNVAIPRRAANPGYRAYNARMVIARRVLYSGHVQGVGFRYTAYRLAQGLALAGFVRNLQDGQVELVAEGEAAVVEALLRRVAESMADHVTDAVVADVPMQGFAGFQIRH